MALWKISRLGKADPNIFRKRKIKGDNLGGRAFQARHDVGKRGVHFQLRIKIYGHDKKRKHRKIGNLCK
jgi:hypothetical protein